MFGLQKQRRNAAGGGAWFIAGHLTVFAKLSHHAVPLESRIFSSRCLSFSVPPFPSPPPPFPSRLVVPPTADSCTSLPPSYVTIRRRQHTLIDLRRPDPLPRSRNFLRKLRSRCEQIFEFPWSRKHKFGRAHARRSNFFAHVYSLDNLCNACEKNDRNMRYPLRIFDS